ncbi:hypothetical protein ACFWAY_51120 [Rhodococcus sp. NPDC059968]|uniref:hypothetical protein n=1 Tax=Rhodococcus sp. NPDC059968 TaxID=3347017 RepID=UPI00366D1873
MIIDDQHHLRGRSTSENVLRWKAFGLFSATTIGGMSLLGAWIGNPTLGALGGGLAVGLVLLAAAMLT